MPLVRVQFYAKLPTDTPDDGVSNTLYFDVANFTLVDYENIANDIRGVYQTAGLWPSWMYDIRAYNDEEPKGSPPKARITGTFTGPQTATGPREVALCLSYRTDPPYTARRRGRIYVGPISWEDIDNVRPPASLMTKVLNMGKAFGEIGGENVSWRIKSPTNNDNHHIRYCWVDDAWDTVRGRGQKPTTRQGSDV